MERKEDTPARQARRRYEERNKEERQEAHMTWGTSIERKKGEEINEFLDNYPFSKVDLIMCGYNILQIIAADEDIKAILDEEQKKYDEQYKKFEEERKKYVIKKLAERNAKKDTSMPPYVHVGSFNYENLVEKDTINGEQISMDEYLEQQAADKSSQYDNDDNSDKKEPLTKDELEAELEKTKEYLRNNYISGMKSKIRNDHNKKVGELNEQIRAMLEE